MILINSALSSRIYRVNRVVPKRHPTSVWSTVEKRLNTMWTRVSSPDLAVLRTEESAEGQSVSPWQEGGWEEGSQAQTDMSGEVLHPLLQCPGLCWPTQWLSKLSLRKMKSSSTSHIPPSSLHAGRGRLSASLEAAQQQGHRRTQTSLSSLTISSPDKSQAFPLPRLSHPASSSV